MQRAGKNIVIASNENKKMFWRKYFVALLLIHFSTTALAEEKTPCGHISERIVGECFNVHGRLSPYNGNPTFRIWVIGTHHILNVSSSWIPENEERALYELPKNIRQTLLRDSNMEISIFGDYQVCPLAKARPGWAQPVCIVDAKNLVMHGR